MKRIPFPIIIISVFVAALGVIYILLASLSTEDTDTTDGEDNWKMLVLAYVVAAMCVMEDTEHDDEEIMERPAKHCCLKYDHSQAKAAVWNDYQSPVSTV